MIYKNGGSKHYGETGKNGSGQSIFHFQDRQKNLWFLY